MKKALQILVVILLFIVSGLIFWAGLSPETYSNFWKNHPLFGKNLNESSTQVSEIISGEKGQVTIGNNTWEVEIATTETQKENGLSNRQSLRFQDGMLFAFDKTSYQSFWMKDMLISLDMIFIDENWKIALIEKDLTARTFPKIFGNSVKSKYVLEINGGQADSFGLKVGDQVIFANN